MKGKLIAIYGIQDCGKTTQSEILVQTLKRKEYRAEYLKYPDYKSQPTGQFLDEFLHKKQHLEITERELQLWFLLNRLQHRPKLKDLLDGQKYIIAENYIGTSLAYGALSGVSEKWLAEINRPCITPDVSILIDSERAIKDSTGDTNKTFRAFRETYIKLAQNFAWYTVNGDQKIMEVHSEIWDIIKKVI